MLPILYGAIFHNYHNLLGLAAMPPEYGRWNRRASLWPGSFRAVYLSTGWYMRVCRWSRIDIMDRS